MEKDYSILSKIIEENEIRIESYFGLRDTFNLGEINRFLYKKKCSILTLSNDFVCINYKTERKNDLLEILVNFYSFK